MTFSAEDAALLAPVLPPLGWAILTGGGARVIDCWAVRYKGQPTCPMLHGARSSSAGCHAELTGPLPVL